MQTVLKSDKLAGGVGPYGEHYRDANGILCRRLNAAGRDLAEKLFREGRLYRMVKKMPIISKNLPRIAYWLGSDGFDHLFHHALIRNLCNHDLSKRREEVRVHGHASNLKQIVARTILCAFRNERHRVARTKSRCVQPNGDVAWISEECDQEDLSFPEQFISKLLNKLPLTNAQTEYLKLLLKGWTTRQIMDHLGVTRQAIDNHKFRIVKEVREFLVERPELLEEFYGAAMTEGLVESLKTLLLTRRIK